MCDAPLTLQEITDPINSLKHNKSPGVDGVTSEFYRAFVQQLAPFLLKVFTQSINNEPLPPTLTQGLFTLIPKTKKDVLNHDYKVPAITFAKRLKPVLDPIIDESQSGFMNNRHISNNIKLVLDLLDYSDVISDDRWILFLDFYKAFDSVEHQFIFSALEKFGFGPFLFEPYTQIVTVLLN